jgi:hypothetical protein
MYIYLVLINIFPSFYSTFKMQNATSNIQVMEGNFCRVVGSIRQTQDRRHVMAFRVAKLNSANEITTHLLETQWIRMKLRQMKRKMVLLNNLG